MVVIVVVCLFFGFAVDEVESFELMFLEEDGKGSFQEIYPRMKVDHVQQAVDGLLDTLPLLCFFPVGGAPHAFHKFVDQLLQEIAEVEFIENALFEVLFSECELKEEPAEDGQKHKNSQDSLEHASHIRHSIQQFEEAPGVDNCLRRALKVHKGGRGLFVMVSPGGLEFLGLDALGSGNPFPGK